MSSAQLDWFTETVEAVGLMAPQQVVRRMGSISAARGLLITTLMYRNPVRQRLASRYGRWLIQVVGESCDHIVGRKGRHQQRRGQRTGKQAVRRLATADRAPNR